jgi:hypothetical protein
VSVGAAVAVLVGVVVGVGVGVGKIAHPASARLAGKSKRHTIRKIMVG